MIGVALLGVIHLLLLKCYKASEPIGPYSLTIKVGNDYTFHGQAFKGEIFQYSYPF